MTAYAKCTSLVFLQVSIIQRFNLLYLCIALYVTVVHVFHIFLSATFSTVYIVIVQYIVCIWILFLAHSVFGRFQITFIFI